MALRERFGVVAGRVVKYLAKFERPAEAASKFTEDRRSSGIRIEGSSVERTAHAGDTLRLFAAFSYVARPVLLHGAFVVSGNRSEEGPGGIIKEMFWKEARDNGKPKEHCRPGRAEGEAGWR